MGNKILIDKRIFIVIILIPTVLILLSSYFVYQVIVGKGLSAKKTAPKEEITSTGYIPEELNEEEKRILYEENRFYDMLPLQTDKFSVEYNYELDKYQVKSGENKTAKDDLTNWLVDNNLNDIPPERFIFE